MSDTYDLSKLGPSAFENLVNFLALKTLGPGATGFGPGADGGRDGYFEGEASYPSPTQRWTGIWYIQSKFHAPSLSPNPQKWLQQQISKELKAFLATESKRRLPDNWIIATNIDPSGKSKGGSFDIINKTVRTALGSRKMNVHVWGGKKILGLLSLHEDVARHFGHFLTPGHILSALYEHLSESRASIKEIIRYFVATQFVDHTFTKLDQAGSSADVRPAVHDLFVDLPFSYEGHGHASGMLATLTGASEQCLRHSVRAQVPDSWRKWSKQPKRSRVLLIKGGPGQGKSTIAQYLCQIHRASLILADDGPPVLDSIRSTASNVSGAASRDGYWPTSPRIPIQMELKDFAHWFSQRSDSESRSVLSYLAATLSKRLGIEVLPKTLKHALSKMAWIVVFDGLDEVPNDFKDHVAKEAIEFLNDVLVDIDADVLAICTSRPQGYSGQFSGLDGPVTDLAPLDATKALECAKPVLRFGRAIDESLQAIETLAAAIKSANIRELMTTPLQSHIMAVVVRDGGRPPDKRWQLFNNFYNVMKKRESQKSVQNPRIARLLREEDRLLKSVHTHLGFVLHARAERSEGAQTTLSKLEFRQLVLDVVKRLVEHDIEDTVDCVMEATTERLVLVSTPESGDHVRFDIRQLQEFFAAEFLYAGVDSRELRVRLETIGGDAHWREVVHFLISALIENQRATDVAVSVDVLRRLNEGADERSPTRLYFRRMNKGGWLACRLLQEGVLEPDQRDRQQLRPLFDSVAGALDLSNLSELRRLHGSRSRQWLVQLLLEKLDILNPTEYAGALLVLGWLLPNDSGHSANATHAFMSSPVRLQEIICRFWESDSHSVYRPPSSESEPRPPLSDWVIDVAISILNSESWIRYTSSCLRGLINICQLEIERIALACTRLGLSASTASGLLELLQLQHPNAGHATLDRRSSINYGYIRGTSFSENWRNGRLPDALAKIDATTGIAETGGMFQLMFTCVQAARSRAPSDLADVASQVQFAGADRLDTVPSVLLALIPLGGPHAVHQYAVDGLLSGHPGKKDSVDMGGVYAELTLREDGVTAERCEALCRDLPRIAIELAFNHPMFPMPDCKQWLPQLTAILDNAPELAAPYILQWGHLEPTCQIRLDHLKRHISGISSKVAAMRSYSQIMPFVVTLPADNGLLPLLAAAFIEHFSTDDADRGMSFRSERNQKSFRQVLKEYGLDLDELRLIADTPNLERRIRAAALAIYWWNLVPERSALSDQPVINLHREITSYLAVVDDETETWLTRSFVRGVLASRSETDLDALLSVTRLLERCQDGGGPRDEVSELLLLWRERSLAPVHAMQALHTWLGYNFQAPTYLTQ